MTNDEHHFFLLKTVDLKNKERSCPSLFEEKATFIRSDAILYLAINSCNNCGFDNPARTKLK